jgi:hypothetical protein
MNSVTLQLMKMKANPFIILIWSKGSHLTCETIPLWVLDLRATAQFASVMFHCQQGGEDIGAFTDPNDDSTAGAASSENATTPATSSIITDCRGQFTAEPTKLPSTNPRPCNASLYRFSTRQQAYGPVDVRITIHGIGGSK